MVLYVKQQSIRSMQRRDRMKPGVFAYRVAELSRPARLASESPGVVPSESCIITVLLLSQLSSENVKINAV